jgi:hypothetical protein
MRNLVQGGEPFQLGLIRGMRKGNTLFLGVYDGSTFEGSDRLSMAVSKDYYLLHSLTETNYLNIVCEGDRFTNQKYIAMFAPYIIKIEGNGAAGREQRKSNQTERHLKAIATRVNNIPAHLVVPNSQTAHTAIIKALKTAVDVQ